MYCTVAILGLAVIGTLMPQIADRALNSAILRNPGVATRMAVGGAGVFISLLVSVFWPGMMFECLTSKDLRSLPKAAWLLLILATNLIGALIFYFARYRKQAAEV